MSLTDPFWDRIDRSVGSDACWIFGTSKSIPTYRGQNAQRVAWTLAYGEGAPANEYVRRLCKNKGCVNPRHLYLAADRAVKSTAKFPVEGEPIESEKIALRFWKKVDRRGPAECWNYTGFVYGTGGLRLGFDLYRKSTYAHRVAWRLERGGIPEGICVTRACRNRLCVNPNHLALQKFTSPHAKLTKEQVLEIRRRRRDGETYKQIAKTLSIDASTAWRIANRMTHAGVR